MIWPFAILPGTLAEKRGADSSTQTRNGEEGVCQYTEGACRSDLRFVLATWLYRTPRAPEAWLSFNELTPIKTRYCTLGSNGGIFFIQRDGIILATPAHCSWRSWVDMCYWSIHIIVTHLQTEQELFILTLQCTTEVWNNIAVCSIDFLGHSWDQDFLRTSNKDLYSLQIVRHCFNRFLYHYKRLKEQLMTRTTLWLRLRCSTECFEPQVLKLMRCLNVLTRSYIESFYDINLFYNSCQDMGLGMVKKLRRDSGDALCHSFLLAL
jgi:hypothetical protein